MTMKSSFAAVLAVLGLPAFSQTVVAVNVANADQAMAGEAVSITVALHPGERKPWCGLTLSFGDGSSVDQRIEDSRQTLVVAHAYASPGTYQVRVEGKRLVRGFATANPCDGVARTAMVRVVDGEAVRRAAEADEAQRRVRDAEARQRELALKEQELRAREAELKERELRAREAALKAREGELKRQAAAAAPKPASPQQPGTPPAPARKDATLDVFK